MCFTHITQKYIDSRFICHSSRLYTRFVLSSVFALGCILLLFSFAAAEQLTLAWDDPDNDSSDNGVYRLYYWQPGWEMPDSVEVGGQTSYTITGLEVGKTYHFAVTVHDGQGGRESIRSNEISKTFSPLNTAPVAQDSTLSTSEDTLVTGTLVASDADGDALTYRLLSADSSAAPAVSLAWDDPDNDPSVHGVYRLYYWQSQWQTPASVEVGSQTNYTITGLEAGKTYGFAVTVHDG